MCKVGTRTGLSFPEGSNADNSVSRLILSNNLSYNLCSFVWELVHLEKNPSSKIVCVECKMIFSYSWCIKQYSLFSYPINFINLEYGTSFLAQTLLERNI